MDNKRLLIGFGVSVAVAATALACGSNSSPASPSSNVLPETNTPGADAAGAPSDAEHSTSARD